VTSPTRRRAPGPVADQASPSSSTPACRSSPSQAEAHPANRAIESTGGAFVEEVRGSLDYYLAQPGAARIGRVVPVRWRLQAVRPGRAADRRHRLPVDVAHPCPVLKMGKTGLTDEQLAYVEPMVTVPVGLASRVAS
jgi:type IV pilus assembly protein PilM